MIGAIGDFLERLTVEEEDRILTERMGPGEFYDSFSDTQCLVGAAVDYRRHRNLTGLDLNRTPADTIGCVWGAYDDACKRFGTARVNAAVRSRILANRLRKLGPVPPRDTAVLPLLAHSLET